MQPFNLDMWLEDKSRKVVTRDGRPVRIVCWDVKGLFPILALLEGDGKMDTKKGDEYPCSYRIDGTCPATESYDLFFADEEEELTEFENKLRELVDDVRDGYYIDSELGSWKKKLLELARKETEKENSEFNPKFTYNEKDYSELANKLIEFRNNTPLCSVSYRDGDGRKIILHYEKEITDLVKKEILEEFRCREELFHKNGFERGRESILKNLPKLEKTKDVIDSTIPVMYTNAASMKTYVEYHGYKLCINDVFEKLPKEE